MSANVSFNNIRPDDYGNVFFDLIVDGESTRLYGDSVDGVVHRRYVKLMNQERILLAGSVEEYRKLPDKQKFSILNEAIDKAGPQSETIRPYVERVWPEVKLHIRPIKPPEPPKKEQEEPTQVYLISKIWFFTFRGQKFVELFHATSVKEGRIYSLFVRILTLMFGKPQIVKQKLPECRF